MFANKPNLRFVACYNFIRPKQPLHFWIMSSINFRKVLTVAIEYNCGSVLFHAFSFIPGVRLYTPPALVIVVWLLDKLKNLLVTNKLEMMFMNISYVFAM